MTDKSSRELCLYFPLWGAAFDSDGVGLVGGPLREATSDSGGNGILGVAVLAYILEEEEWSMVQQIDVRHARDLDPPPVCLVAVAWMGTNEHMDQAIHRVGGSMLRSARNAVSALRLYKPGWFLEPELAERTFTVTDVIMRTRRLPGPYRQVFLDDRSPLPSAGYSLRIAELGPRPDEPGPITRVWELLEAYHQTGGNSSAEIALENFNRSFGYQLSSVQRAANLFTALDAMFGGMSARRIGRVPLRRNSFGRRVRAALGALDAARYGGLDPDAAAAWLDSKEGGRSIRNAIAHGQPRSVEAAAEAAQEQLEGIVRLLLRQYLEFAVRWKLDGDALAERFRLPVRSPLPVAYNKVIDTHVSGRDDARDVLCFGLSVDTEG
jgi:hypothetical protein